MDATVTRPLRVGLFLPTWTPGNGMEAWTSAAYPDGPRWGDILATARLAEDAGFDSVWVCDHMLMDDDWEAPDDGVLGPAALGSGTWDAWALLAGLGRGHDPDRARARWSPARRTRTPPGWRRLVDTIDEISGGRLIARPGCRRPLERVPALRRARSSVLIARFEEALQIIVPLLREGRVDFEGEFYAARDCELSPRGRPSGPPILIGALGPGPRMVRLVATYADLWNGWYSFDRRAGVAPARDPDGPVSDRLPRARP